MTSIPPPPDVPPFIALIPARRASTRLPDKALADIHGRPMVVRVAERAAYSGAQRVIVATDDGEIAAACRHAGYEAMLTRADHASGTDRLAEVVTRLDLDDASLIVNVQGDEPLIDPMLVSRCATHLAAHPGCAMATASHAIHDEAEMNNPNIVKVVCDRAGRALYFSRAPIPWKRDARADHLHPPGQRHIGLYAYRAEFLKLFPELKPAPLEHVEALEQLRALWHGHAIAVFETEHAPAPGVDTLTDLERVRALFTPYAR